jgi:ferric-dicitrate binding protein FerR (iron transport regulator)
VNEELDIKIASWIAARLRGDISPAENALLEAWLAEREENRALYARVTAGERLERRLREYEERSLARTRRRLLAAIRGGKRAVLARRLARVAAAVVISLLAWFIAREIPAVEEVASLLERVPGDGHVVLELPGGRCLDLSRAGGGALEGVPARVDSAVLTYLSPGTPGASAGENVLSTSRGGEYRIVLADGTRVWLNAGSRLRYPVTFTGDAREVSLDGEAYFEVADAGTPFRVRAGGTVVEALGTSFNVMSYDDEPAVQATLVSGKVRVSVEGRPATAVVLHPGEQATVAGGEIETRAVNTCNYTSWRESIFFFDDESLEVIARKLSRWYDVEIELASPALHAASFYGVIPKYASILKFLEERLCKVYDMEYAIDGKRIIIKQR